MPPERRRHTGEAAVAIPADRLGKVTAERAGASTGRHMAKLVLNEQLPGKIRRALVSEAKRRDIRMNDAAGEALARHFGLEFELSGLPYRVERARIDKVH